jgi:glycosyl transferase family 25
LANNTRSANEAGIAGNHEKGFAIMLESSHKAPPISAVTLGPASIESPADCFDRTYVINLVERKDRLKEITCELQKLRMTFADPKVRLLSATRCQESRGFPTAAVRGCFLSHLTILLQAQSDGLKNVLIMEDDLAISPAFKDYCRHLFQEAEQQPWGFLYFGHREDTPALNVPRLAPFTGPIATTHFYAVNATILGRLIDYLQAVQLRAPGDPVGGPMHYDGALTMFREAHPDINTLIAQPSLGWQRSSRSDIHGHWYDKVWGLRNAADMARSLRRKNYAFGTPNDGPGEMAKN